MQHMVIGRKSHAIGDSVSLVSVTCPVKGKLDLMKDGKAQDVIQEIKENPNCKGDEFDGKRISW